MHWCLAKTNHVPLRQSYLRVCKTAQVKSDRYRHANRINVLLAGIGYNFRPLLRRFRFFCVWISIWVRGADNKNDGQSFFMAAILWMPRSKS